MSKNELYSWLIPYLEGQLDPKRTAAVEARLGIDTEYAAEAARLRNVLRHVQASSAVASQTEPEFSIWPKVQSQLRAHPAQNRWSPRLSLAAGAFSMLLIGVVIAHPWEHGHTSHHVTVMAANSHAPVIAGIVSAPKLDKIQGEVQKTAKTLERTYHLDGSASHTQPKSDAPVVAAVPKHEGIETSDTFTDRPQIGDDSDPFNPRAASSVEVSDVTTPRPTAHPKHHTVKHHTEALPLRGDMMAAASGTGRTFSDGVVPSASDMLSNRVRQSDADVLANPASEIEAGAGNRYSEDANNSVAAGNVNLPKRPDDFSVLPSPLLPTSKAFTRSNRAHDMTDGQKLRSLLQTASMRASRGNVNEAMDSWRDAMLFELQPPTYNEEGATMQAASILETIRKTGNLVPFRAFVEHQASPNPDEVVDWRILGLLYAKQANNTLALGAWKYVTESGKASGEDWYQLGLTRQALGDTANARLAFAHAISGLTPSAAHYAAAQQALTAGE